jgi:hypothetical protein
MSNFETYYQYRSEENSAKKALNINQNARVSLH